MLCCIGWGWLDWGRSKREVDEVNGRETMETKMKLSEVKRELSNLPQKELITIISDLYKKNKDVQHYFSIKFGGEEAAEELFLQALEKVEHQFFPKRGHGALKLAEAKKAIQHFEKLTGDKERTLRLKIAYVDFGTKFTQAYGDISWSYYNSMASMFDSIVDQCCKNEIYYEKYRGILFEIVQNSDGIGWGYSDFMYETYYDAFGIEEEEL